METNKHLDMKLTLSEFYNWLGCRFYMAWYVGVSPINFGDQKTKRACSRVPPFASRMSYRWIVFRQTTKPYDTQTSQFLNVLWTSSTTWGNWLMLSTITWRMHTHPFLSELPRQDYEHLDQQVLPTTSLLGLPTYSLGPRPKISA
jgi:hypothetical protein